MTGPLPRGVHDLLARFAAVIATRPPRRALPAMLLAGPSAGRIVAEVRASLTGDHDLVPHARVTDADATATAGLVIAVADRLQASMPEGAGTLRLPLLRTCQALFSLEPGDADDLTARRGELRDRLYERLAARRPALGRAHAIATETGSWLLGFPQNLAQVLLATLPRLVYGVWLSRSRSLRWVGGMLGPRNRSFTRVALEVTGSGASVEAALVQQVLLTALLRDLDRATRPSRWWVYRRRRRWSFVVLLDAVGGAGSPCKEFLDAYAQVAGPGVRSPLLVLGALVAEDPSVAKRITPGEVAARYAASDDLVYVVPLAEEDDDGAARRWIETNPRVRTRPDSRWDYVRVAAPLVLLLTAGALVPAYASTPSSCRAVAGDEIIGVTDGVECDLASPGAQGDLLRELETLAETLNQAVDLSKPYRDVVFYAPVTIAAGSGNTTLNGIQSLRGALLAVAEVNARPGVHHMQLRILIANPGDAFGHGPEVTAMILDRARLGRIAAVVGITQSRPASLAAVTALSDGKVPVIGSSVTGSAMVAGPAAPLRNFQVSPSNTQIARIMAAFAGDRPPVIVTHPDDPIFSIDLGHKLEALLEPGRTSRVHYAESGRGPGARDAAQQICERARSGGFVIYAGRSARLQELLDAMGDREDCARADGSRIGFLTESLPSGFLDDPGALASRYPFATFSYLAFDSSAAPKAERHPFAAGFTAFFRSHDLPGYQPNGDAAGAYDAVMVASRAVDEAFALNAPDEDFPANDVYGWLSSSGVEGMNGATGAITLNRNHRYPPDKTIFILGVDPVTSVARVLLECGPGACPPGR
ncbi:ABC transporter substrate-binding protein [Herbidospora mongoliensis]|uniref:ABC transporter substrate-binding protein n=1 Tax=Herbidospora mongoliensis TaxID=688067 RepID=UPI000AE8C0A1|nr:hypothetical protein [Herbidospora mongoliensis]